MYMKWKDDKSKALTLWLKELQMDEADIAEILAKNECYGSQVAPLAEGYMNGRTVCALQSFTDEECTRARDEALLWLGNAQKLAQSQEDDYMLQLLFWLHCIPYLEQDFRRAGIGRDILVNSLMDLTYKTRECRKKFGCCGVATQRYYRLCCMGLFGLGRLQFNPLVNDKETYHFGAYVLNPGDRIYGCHIPSSGKLMPELCMDSLERAYNFFKKDIKGDILPVRCSSWLLYPPYADKVFPDGSNLKAFAQMFDIVSATSIPEDSYVLQTVFGKTSLTDLDNFPQETGLQKSFVSYLKSGGDFGRGYGILLYDGVKKEIVNTHTGV